MSRILDVYDALANMEVKSTKPLKIFNLEALPESVDTANLPARFLLPLSPQPMEGRDGMFINMGKRINVQWVINDLMLWQASEQGSGLKGFARDLVDYCGNYIEEIKQHPCLAGCVVKSFNVRTGVFEWPVMSGRYFAGALAEITVEELI